jgi:hypothetical protein
MPGDLQRRTIKLLVLGKYQQSDVAFSQSQSLMNARICCQSGSSARRQSPTSPFRHVLTPGWQRQGSGKTRRRWAVVGDRVSSGKLQWQGVTPLYCEPRLWHCIWPWNYEIRGMDVGLRRNSRCACLPPLSVWQNGTSLGIGEILQ